MTCREVQQAQALGDLGLILHRGADQGDLALVVAGRLGDLADTVQVAGEGRDQDAAPGAGDRLAQPRPHGPFTGGEAWTIGVGAVGEQHQHPFVAQLLQSLEVGTHAVQRIGVELEVGGVHDHAHRSADREHRGLGNRVGDRQGLDLERPDLEAIAARIEGLQIRIDAPFLQPVADEGQGVGAAVHRHRVAVDQPGHAADVVFVGVGQHQAVDRAAALEKGEVGDDDVDAVVLGAGEHHARVEDQAVGAVAQHHQVHAELTEPAKGDQLEVVRRSGRQTGCPIESAAPNRRRSNILSGSAAGQRPSRRRASSRAGRRSSRPLAIAWR